MGDNKNSNSVENPVQDSESSEIVMDESSLATVVGRFKESMSIGSKVHKFSETQFKDVGESNFPEGPIKQEPYNLPSAYEWTTCDMDSEETCNEVYTLLKNNYVEDDKNMFRINYSKEFLRWALRPPGFYQRWHIGVRVKASKKLVAFTTGTPARYRDRDEEVVKIVEINFSCVHKKLRSKSLDELMMMEVTRRVHLENICQGLLLPTSIATCKYWHRSLNPKKLIDVGFSKLGKRMTMSRAIKLFKLADSPVTPGFRKMELRDVPPVTRLLRNYLAEFAVALPEFDENDVEQWLLPREDVVDSFVVESPETHEITDFCSFYTRPSSIPGNPNYTTLKSAYSYYNVATKTPLLQLVNDALIVAKKMGFDVFSALEAIQNESFLKELKFGRGNSGHPDSEESLYNYRVRSGLTPTEFGPLLL